MPAAAEEVLDVPLTLSAPASTHGIQAIRFDIEATDASVSKSVDANFFGPTQ